VEPGEHLIQVKQFGKSLLDSPIPVTVEAAEPENAVGSPCDFPLVIPSLNLPDDLSKLSLTMKRPGSSSEEPIQPKLLSDNTLNVAFLPKSPGEHLISVKKRNRPVPGSPFSAVVTASEPSNEIGKPSSVPLENIPAKDLPKLDAGLLRPGSTVEEPITIKKTSDDNLYAPFIPHEEGPHQINVRKDGKPVPNGSYLLDVPPKDVEDGRLPGKAPRPEKVPSPEKSPVQEQSPLPDKDIPSSVQPVQEVHPAGKPCDVGLDVPGVVLPDDAKKLTATIQRPGSNKKEPVTPEIKPDNTLGKTCFLPYPFSHSLLSHDVSGKTYPPLSCSIYHFHLRYHPLRPIVHTLPYTHHACRNHRPFVLPDSVT
jgi:filamin